MTEPLASFQWFYGVILALALTEALVQYAQTTVGKGDGLLRFFTPSAWALIGLLVVIVPFFHGMNMYLHGVYAGEASSRWFLLDASVFMVEATILFLLSRALKPADWVTFYGWVAILLLIDAAWGLGVCAIHDARTVWWAAVNLAFAPLLLLACWWGRQWRGTGAPDCLVLLCLRTVMDYWSSWTLYFPPPSGA